ncbi:hypothetical protein GCM10017576_11110 [Microbacterium barkeri]|uniref:Uncharacterized protein n=1 Tax=Microbacterium barkeri TaxID=33917 RepID=A0A9W6H2B2_9MICO|nr:hypothetical protein [Microbacterium barkeri]MDI6942982.1 hypothetical protein [Microbacterium barkeri]GLJ60982.1 hypothetical protein GCM10017576_11110 [Microbacterium barkeri]
MRFLLIVPLNGYGAPLLESGSASSDEAFLVSRSTSNPEVLVQRWVDAPALPARPEVAFDIDKAALCEVGGRSYLALEAVGSVSAFEDDIVGLETALSGHARQYVADHLGVGQEHVPWVARYALVPEGGKEPVHWMAAESECTDVTQAAGVSFGEVAVEMGWGNGVIRGWDRLSEPSRYHIVRGIIDAQHIWNDAAAIMTRNDAAFRAVIGAQERPRRKEIRRLAREAASIEIDASSHQLLFDDLIQNVQGVRRQSAEVLLRAWRYERFVGRMLDRVRDLAQQIANLQTRAESRYQGAVQATLLVLGFLVVVDTALSFIGTAFSGDVTGVPGGESGIFAALRDSDADVMLAGALLITALLVLLFARRR